MQDPTAVCPLCGGVLPSAGAPPARGSCTPASRRSPLAPCGPDDRSAGNFSQKRFRALHTGGPLEGLPRATGLERDTPIPAELRFTPSREVALATRRLDRFLGNSVTRPIQLTVVETEGTWTEEDP